MLFYHLTTNENVESILKEGLVPQIGENSRRVGEENPKVYLCSKDDIPYWMILLGRDKVLEVDISPYELVNLKHYDYSLYGEYLYSYTISPLNTKLYEKDIIITDDIIRTLCKDFLITVSMLCVEFARISNKEESYSNDMSIDNYLNIFTRLDFKLLSEEEIRKVFTDYGEEGMYPITDVYEPDSRKPRLWEWLIMSKYTSENSKRLYRWIKNNIPESCLYINTGGLTD